MRSVVLPASAFNRYVSMMNQVLFRRAISSSSPSTSTASLTFLAVKHHRTLIMGVGGLAINNSNNSSSSRRRLQTTAEATSSSGQPSTSASSYVGDTSMRHLHHCTQHSLPHWSPAGLRGRPPSSARRGARMVVAVSGPGRPPPQAEDLLQPGAQHEADQGELWNLLTLIS